MVDFGGKNIETWEDFKNIYLSLTDSFEIRLYYDYLEEENGEIEIYSEEFILEPSILGGYAIGRDRFETKEELLDYLYNYQYDNGEYFRDCISEMYRM